ncbi:restriction endonuclease subunit S [Alphaproteobacteria bacterium]|nr:restriction endonuclease subunit S [Alphaproteobacteria bacterium]
MWKTVTLGDVCDFQNGFAFKSSLFKENGKPILRISNIQNEEIDTRKTVYFDAKDYDTDFSRYEVKPDDLLIAMSGATTGKIGFNKTDTTYYLNQRVGNLKPKPTLDKVFLYYLLSTKVQENLSISKGAAQPNLSSEQIKNISFSLPPLAEQQRIVAKLDAAFAEIDGVIGQTEKKIHHAKLLMQRTIDESIKGESSDMLKVKLDEFCDIKHGFAFDGKSFSVSDDESKPIVLTPGNFAENGTTKFNDKNTKRLQIEYDKKLLFSTDDLVIVMTDLSSKMLLLGKPAFVKQSNILHNQRIGLVKNSEQIIVNDYLYFYFRTTNYLNEIKKTASGTMVRHTAPKRILRNTITAPKSLSEQRAISTKITMSLSKSENLIDIYKTKVSNLLSLKSAILAQELQSEAA